ncbi:TrkA-N domain protein [mine drainage metagenome]|uniref:TrkA-N domain protein n=1 Tax=mine drainage metagenome TaxID=410659 RepID=T0YSD6_9ZZZZ
MASQITITAYAIAIVAVLAFGTVGTYVLGHNSSGNFSVRIDNWIEALYFTVTTISTVGYGDIVPVSSIARIFDMVLILSGLGAFFAAVTTLSGDFVNSRLVKLSGKISGLERKMLTGHIVLIGFDTTNALLASKLKKQKRKFIVVTEDKALADKLKDEGFNAYIADITSETDMKAFRLDRAKRVIVDVRDVSRTIYAAIVAKSLSSSNDLIIVAATEDVERHLRELNMRHIVNPSAMAANMIDSNIPK